MLTIDVADCLLTPELLIPAANHPMPISAGCDSRRKPPDCVAGDCCGDDSACFERLRDAFEDVNIDGAAATDAVVALAIADAAARLAGEGDIPYNGFLNIDDPNTLD